MDCGRLIARSLAFQTICGSASCIGSTLGEDRTAEFDTTELCTTRFNRVRRPQPEKPGRGGRIWPTVPPCGMGVRIGPSPPFPSPAWTGEGDQRGGGITFPGLTPWATFFRPLGPEECAPTRTRREVRDVYATCENVPIKPWIELTDEFLSATDALFE